MPDPILSYAPGSPTVAVDGHTCDIKRAVLSEGFRVDPIVYAGQDQLKWLASFIACYRTSRGSEEGRGLWENPITEATIRGVLKVFPQMVGIKQPGHEVDLLIPSDGSRGLVGLGRRFGGEAVIFRDHLS